MELRTFLRALRKFWWVIALATLLGGAGGAAVAFRSTPQYASTVTFFATTPSTAPGGGSAYAGDQFAQQRVNTYVELLSSDRLAKLVLQDPTLNLTADQITGMVTGKSQPDTVLLVATVTDTDKARSLQIATGVSREFPALVGSIESDNGTKNALVSLDVVNGPGTLVSPISPRPKLDIALGLVVGFVIGIALALVREVFDTTVRSVAMLRDLTGVPVLGVLTVDAAARRSPLILDSSAQSLRAESFRQLRTGLQFVDVEEPASVIVVTSSVAQEGKSTIVTNLAITFAEAGQKVLIVDADLRRPKIADYLDLEGSVGLTNVLAAQVDVDDVIQTYGSRRLDVLPSGSIPPNPSELLGSAHMLELIRTLRERYDIVLIDTPPLLPVTDAAVAAIHADGAVVVVRHGKTRRTEVVRAIETLRAVDARVLGTVLNSSPAKGAEAHGRYREYGYSSNRARSVGHTMVTGAGQSSPDSAAPSTGIDNGLTDNGALAASANGAAGQRGGGQRSVADPSAPSKDATRTDIADPTSQKDGRTAADKSTGPVTDSGATTRARQ